MNGEHEPEEALDRLVSELRAESAPKLDWQRLEARLMREPYAKPPSIRERVFRGLRVPAMVLVATGALALIVVRRRPVPARLGAAPSKSLMARVASGPLDGNKLALGTHVTAGNQNVVIEHAGRARWTLEPHATAVVANSGEDLTLRLESGALSAIVVPSSKPETFAVEAGNTRVAVHGTAFRVERSGERVLVQVSEGTVAVEPTQAHSDPSFLLRRDSRGNFGLDGRSGSIEGNASVILRDTRGQSRREIMPSDGARLPTPRLSSHSALGARAALNGARVGSAHTPSTLEKAAGQPPLQPCISDIENGVTSAIELLNGCFRGKTQSASNRVSVSTGMSLSVAPDGSVRTVTFSPPLGPTVEDCAVIGLRKLVFTRSIEGVSFTRILELTR